MHQSVLQSSTMKAPSFVCFSLFCVLCVSCAADDALGFNWVIIFARDVEGRADIVLDLKYLLGDPFTMGEYNHLLVSTQAYPWLLSPVLSHLMTCPVALGVHVDFFGPELQLSHHIANSWSDPLTISKATCWDESSLAVNWCPLSSQITQILSVWIVTSLAAPHIPRKSLVIVTAKWCKPLTLLSNVSRTPTRRQKFWVLSDFRCQGHTRGQEEAIVWDKPQASYQRCHGRTFMRLYFPSELVNLEQFSIVPSISFRGNSLWSSNLLCMTFQVLLLGLCRHQLLFGQNLSLLLWLLLLQSSLLR